ncbi:MAG: hypothetical protein NC184_01590 [Roseburia sp.]|nr:hypothetical protein [Roseburia sp.]
MKKRTLVILEIICTVIYLGCLATTIYLMVSQNIADISVPMLLGCSIVFLIPGVLLVFFPRKIFHVIYSIIYKTSKVHNDLTDESMVSEQDSFHHIDRGIVACFVGAVMFILAGLLIQIFMH